MIYKFPISPGAAVKSELPDKTFCKQERALSALSRKIRLIWGVEVGKDWSPLDLWLWKGPVWPPWCLVSHKVSSNPSLLKKNHSSFPWKGIFLKSQFIAFPDSAHRESYSLTIIDESKYCNIETFHKHQVTSLLGQKGTQWWKNFFFFKSWNQSGFLLTKRCAIINVNS